MQLNLTVKTNETSLIYEADSYDWINMTKNWLKYEKKYDNNKPYQLNLTEKYFIFVEYVQKI